MVPLEAALVAAVMQELEARHLLEAAWQGTQHLSRWQTPEHAWTDLRQTLTVRVARVLQHARWGVDPDELP